MELLIDYKKAMAILAVLVVLMYVFPVITPDVLAAGQTSANTQWYKKPTWTPTKKPTWTPKPTWTAKPTWTPTKKPTWTPTKKPTWTPTKKPTWTPTKKPTWTPTKKPTWTPTPKPTNSSKIKGLKFNDTNMNGKYDPGEPGVPGIRIWLLDSNQIFLQQTTTDGNGYYQFSGLGAGVYYVMELVPAGRMETTPVTVEVNVPTNHSVINVCFGNVPMPTPSITVTPTPSPTEPRTIGFWKNSPEKITPLLPIWLGTPNGQKSVFVNNTDEAVMILSQPDASNGIVRLYAQMLATKLNIANGAVANATVLTAISEADAFLALNDASDWDGLSPADKAQVNEWKDIFDAFNNSGGP